MSSSVPMFFEFEMDVIMRTLYGDLFVATKSSVVPGKFNAVEEHMDLGLYALSVTRPCVTYQID